MCVSVRGGGDRRIEHFLKSNDLGLRWPWCWGSSGAKPEYTRLTAGSRRSRLPVGIGIGIEVGVELSGFRDFGGKSGFKNSNRMPKVQDTGVSCITPAHAPPAPFLSLLCRLIKRRRGVALLQHLRILFPTLCSPYTIVHSAYCTQCEHRTGLAPRITISLGPILCVCVCEDRAGRSPCWQ